MIAFLRERGINPWLPVILLAGSVLRFYNYSEWSLSNDELSAISRLRFDSFSSLIEHGVRPDYHPAGVQIFLYYWTQVFGISPASVRLPFIIAGIAAIAAAYFIARRWFGEMTALFTSASLAFLSYPILYSQLARPYATGLLFSLLAVWFWTGLLFNRKPGRKVLNAAGFSLSVMLCMYNHYFSFLFVAMVGASGLFFLRKKNAALYLGTALGGVALFLPHISVSHEQLGRGGLSGWLGKPEPGFFGDYLFYCFNESWLVLTAVFLLSIYAVIANYRNLARNRYQVLAPAWFLLPMLTGYFYSIYVNPVLQYSILLFSFPFLLIFLFSFFGKDESKKNYLLLAGFLLVGIYSTVKEKKFYSTSHFGVFKELAETTLLWEKQFGKEKISKAFNLIDPYYINYYFERKGEKMPFAFYRGDDAEATAELLKQVEDSEAGYFIYGWSNITNPPDLEQIIRDKYPRVVDRREYFNSGITLYGKGERKVLFRAHHHFEVFGRWDNDELMAVTGEHLSGTHAIMLDSAREFSPSFRAAAASMMPGEGVTLRVSVWVKKAEPEAGGELVISIEAGDKVLDWHSAKISGFVKEEGKWEKVVVSRAFRGQYPPETIVKIYVWNNVKKRIFMDDFEIVTTIDE